MNICESAHILVSCCWSVRRPASGAVNRLTTATSTELRPLIWRPHHAPTALSTACRQSAHQRFLFALVSALLLSDCGEKSLADAPPAAVATQQAVASATDDSGAIASQAVSAPTSRLKRFGVMPHFGDLDTMVERRVIRVLTVYGPGRYFLEDGPRGTVQELSLIHISEPTRP